VFDQELTTDKQTFRFVKHEDFGVMLQGKSDEGWADLYSLDMAYVCEGDIEYGNHFASTGTGSIFTNNIVAVVRTDYGSNILFNNRLKVDSANSATEIELKSSEDFSQALQEHFGIHYSISPAQLESYLANVAV
jgi:N-hydroxyarylamine O-acetyltransferase